jgi:hypothetical protein
MTPGACSQRPPRIFAVPAVLAVVSLVGLVSALLGDDIWDALSWLALTAPLAVAAWAVLRPRR